MIRIPADQINIDEDFNCRGAINPSTCIELALDIEREEKANPGHGLLYPLLVRANRSGELFNGKPYDLVIGFRRFIATTKILNWADVPCEIEYDVDETQARIQNLRENLHRENLNILQEAKAIKPLEVRGMTVKDIGRTFGQSSSWAQVRLNLLRMDEYVQQAASVGLVTQSQIRELYALKPDERKDYLREIQERKEQGDRPPAPMRKNLNRWRPKQRGVAEMREKMEFFRDFYGQGKFSNLPEALRFGCRLLAWATAEISDGELDNDVDEYLAKIETEEAQVVEEDVSALSRTDGGTES
jgi:ParB/RepB/Spo0J family partition protein